VNNNHAELHGQIWKTSKTVKLQSLWFCIIIQERILFVCQALADFFVGLWLIIL